MPLSCSGWPRRRSITPRRKRSCRTCSSPFGAKPPPSSRDAARFVPGSSRSRTTGSPTELRGRRRRPRAENDSAGERLEGLPDPSPDQAEEAWRGHRREVLKRALEELPPPQRQALGLAYFEDLSHGEIASVLGVPLGTAKSRVRAGIESLRGKLAPIAAALALLLLVAGL
ncbi:MAG TPA: sigma-70 family RNA polymerase sigma factor, partial [Thermoanaerobaculia bacterium]